MLISADLVTGSDVFTKPLLQSDHRTIWATVRDNGILDVRGTFRRNYKGWLPADAAPLAAYRVAVDVGVKGSGSNLRSYEGLISDAAATKASTLHYQNSDLHNESPAPRELELQYRRCYDRDRRKALGKQIRGFRRVWQAQSLLAGVFRPSTSCLCAQLVVNGAHTADRAVWHNGLQQYCTEKYTL